MRRNAAAIPNVGLNPSVPGARVSSQAQVLTSAVSARSGNPLMSWKSGRGRAMIAGTTLAALLSAGCGQPATPDGSATSPGTTEPPPSTASHSAASPVSPSVTEVPSTPATSTSSSSSPSSSHPPPDKPMPTTCSKLAASLSQSAQIGQLFMVGVSSGGLTSRDAGILEDTHAGSVLLLGNSRAGAANVDRLSRRVRSATDSPRHVRTLLAVDQEGGEVQRLRGAGFSQIPSANRQASLSNATLAGDATIWARQLKAAGIDANLAPVADVVPAGMERVNQPIGVLNRGYGPDPDVVAGKVSAFIQGMNRAGIATSVKHFPGLGRVRGNTDYEAQVVDRTTTRHDHALAGFRAGVRAGADMVMVSSAYYSRIDADRQAAFSSLIIGGMIRKDLKFSGVVISDDLGAAAVRDLSPGRRAVTFLNAGGDLVIIADPRLAPTMFMAVSAAAKSDHGFGAEILGRATRVIAMKARRGLADCG
jgi:beta-N-acetylhexosaminidase